MSVLIAWSAITNVLENPRGTHSVFHEKTLAFVLSPTRTGRGLPTPQPDRRPSPHVRTMVSFCQRAVVSGVLEERLIRSFTMT